MKFTFYVSFILCLLTIDTSAQQKNLFDDLRDSIQNKLVTQILERANLEFFSEDTLNLFELDAILKSIDTIINNIESPSKVYGHQIFTSGKTDVYLPGTIVKIPDSYVLGNGDVISISIFGESQYEAKLTVDSSGFISPSNMPKILIKGIKWSAVKKLLIRRFSRYYLFRPEQFALSISEPRNLLINILGEVRNPGSYDLSATNTAFNAIFAAGGPSKSGSVRKIQIANGTDFKILDIYEVLNDASTQFNYYLDDNTVIRVPSSEKIVDISGAVMRPMKYELIEGEGLKTLLKYAGGLAANAVKEVIQIKRFLNDQQILIDVNLNELISKDIFYPLMNGDKITVRSIEPTMSNTVNVEGAVKLPGNFALESTQKISSLIHKAGLLREARTDAAFLIRINPDSTFRLIQVNLENIINNPGSSADLDLQPQDKLIVNSQIIYANRSSIYVSGAVKREIQYPFDPDSIITLEQAILLAGGLQPNASDIGYIMRRDPKNLREVEYIQVNIANALEDPKSPANVLLKPRDRLKVLKASDFVDLSFITIEGAVKDTGKYIYDTTLTLKDVLNLVGGLSAQSSGKIDIYRVNMNKNQLTQTSQISVEVDDDFNIISGPSNFSLKPFDKIIARAVPDFKLQSTIAISGEVLFPGNYALIDKNESISEIIRRSGGLTTEAFPGGTYIERKRIQKTNDIGTESTYTVITNLNQALSQPKSKFNLILRDGDHVVVPKIEDVVFIQVKNTTAFYNLNNNFTDALDLKIAVPFTGGKNAKWYIDEFTGGLTDGAKKTSIMVKYPNQSIKKTKRFGPFKKYPKIQQGAAIFIYLEKSVKSQIDKKGTEANMYPKVNKGIILNLTKDDIEK